MTDYERRIKKARASRDACTTFYPEEFYRQRIDSLYAMMGKMRKDRDAAIHERDMALQALGRIKLGELTK